MGYSNSKLATYTNITKTQKNSPRNHAIDTITIHCVVGQWTAKQICDYFADTDRNASCNYGVGKDGSIGLCVDERDRSWCSSSGANDHRAITIEVASDTTHPYAVTTAAYNALIELIADICKRNGIKKLIWSTDKNARINHLNGVNMTCHRDFANKACPGDYLYNREGDIAAKVNAKLGTVTSPAPSVKESGDMTDAEMFAFFKAQGFTEAGVAGLMGNLNAESGLIANNLQNTGNTKLGMSDAQYTAAVDAGTYTNFIRDGCGYGLAQWTFWSRKQALQEFMKAAGVSIGHKRKQCEFLVKELAGFKNVLQTLKTAKTVKEASDIFLIEFERPADKSETIKKKRAEYGQAFYDKYATGKAEQPKVPYLVKVTADELNVRSGPSASYKINMAIKDHGVYTIVEERDGWGRLKSGAGWINLAYTKKV